MMLNKFVRFIKDSLIRRNVTTIERSFAEHIIVFSNNGFVDKTQIQYKDINVNEYGVALVKTSDLVDANIINESALKYDGKMTYFRYEPQRQLMYVKFWNASIADHVIKKYTLQYAINIGFIKPGRLMEYLANYKSFDYQKVIKEFDVRLG